MFDIVRDLADDKEIRVPIGQSKPVAQRFELVLDMEPQITNTYLIQESEIA